MNVELAMKALDLAWRHPEQFDMYAWFSPPPSGLVKDAEIFPPPCGTTACYAGFAALAAAPLGTVIKGNIVEVPDGMPQHVERYAAEALDISMTQAEALFHLYSLEEVAAAVRYLADNPDASPGTLWARAWGGIQDAL